MATTTLPKAFLWLAVSCKMASGLWNRQLEFENKELSNFLETKLFQHIAEMLLGKVKRLVLRQAFIRRALNLSLKIIVRIPGSEHQLCG